MQRFIVSAPAPVRLCDYLPTICPLLGGSGKIFRLAKEKKIKVNGAKCEGGTKVKSGDELTLFVPDELLSRPEGGPLFLAARPALTVVYDDSQLLIVDKPAGLPVMDEAESSRGEQRVPAPFVLGSLLEDECPSARLMSSQGRAQCGIACTHHHHIELVVDQLVSRHQASPRTRVWRWPEGQCP